MHSFETVLKAYNTPLPDLRSTVAVTHFRKAEGICLQLHVAKSTCLVRQEIEQISPSMQ